MTESAKNRTDIRKPVEKHSTAAWADVESTKRISNVPRPDVSMIENAKEYVDENEK